MFCLAYRPNRRVNPRVALPVATSLALLLSMAASPQAMATCVGAQGTTITCTDVSTIPFDNIINFSAGTSAADGNYSVKVAATVGHDGEADVTNNHIVSGYIIANATNSQYSVYGMKGQDGYGIESWELENQVGGVIVGQPHGPRCCRGPLSRERLREVDHRERRHHQRRARADHRNHGQ